MNLPTLERYLIGYVIGFMVFMLAIPYGIYAIATTWYGPDIFNPFIRIIISLLLVIIGLVFAVWSNIALLLKGKGGPTDLFNVAISPRTKHLVVEGPYKYTRNPMVCGAFSCYFAMAIYLNSVPAVIGLIVFFIVVRFYLQETEERRLWRDFGKEFEEYRRHVPMIVPGIFNRRKKG
jgi:protein-S-isoprenylcysteine O-methyltransferase Ste14